MYGSRYYRTIFDADSLTKRTSLTSIPEDISTDDLSTTDTSGSQQSFSRPRRGSWTAGDDSYWTVQDVTVPTNIIPADAPITVRIIFKKNRQSARPRPTRPALPSRPVSMTFGEILGGLFQSPFTANNPSNAQTASSTHSDGPYPTIIRRKTTKRHSWA